MLVAITDMGQQLPRLSREIDTTSYSCGAMARDYLLLSDLPVYGYALGLEHLFAVCWDIW